MKTTLHVKQTKSSIGQTKKTKLLLKGIGLRKIGHSVQIVDTPSTRGMVEKVQHLVDVVVKKS